jgi:1-acyl-sn-glycerol-3-phosphate acyltransferase
MDSIIAVATRMRAELGAAHATPLHHGSHLQRDLGLDSLSRMELLARIEQRCGISLDERQVMDAETLGDLLGAIRRRATPPPVRSAAPAPEPAGAPVDPADALRQPTLLHALEWHLANQPGRVHLRYLSEEGAEETLSYAELAAAARRVAHGLVARDVSPGDSVAIMLPTGAAYLQSFLGCLLVGAVPVPIYPPARAKQIEEHFSRHGRLLANARARLLITVPEALAVSHLLSADVPTLRDRATPEQLCAAPAVPLAHVPAPTDLAFLQYTSGSTGDPKGVMLSHGNLMASLRCMAAALEASHRDVFVSWLPLYHDMGLIGAWFGALVVGFPLVLMSPLTFLARPQCWLEAISQYRGTISGGPNFAYELCMRRIPQEALAGLDLSCWRAAFNGAEPVSAQTIEGFQARFARCGFSPRAMTPVYGLAEATLGVCFTPAGRGPRVETVARDALYLRGRAEPSDPAAAAAASVQCVSSGVPIPGFEVRIASPTGTELPEREEGAVQFRGPGASEGYFRNPARTAELRQDGWTLTGDRGFTLDGELFITGRDKDVVIRAGRNLYPYALESAVAEVPGVRRGCVAVFATSDPANATESLVVVAETREADTQARQSMRAAIHELALQHLGLPADEVVLAPPHTVLKTSSGKIRRSALAAAHQRGELTRAAGRAVWLQMLRLAAGALLPWVRRLAAAARERCHTAWCLFALAAVVTVAWPAIVLSRSNSSAWGRARTAARVLFALCRVRVQRPRPSMPEEQGLVLVSNHQSYLDGLVMLLTFRQPVRFVVKRELVAHPFARWCLEALGVLFVERFDRARAVADSRALVAALRRGERLLFFAEGTFHRMAGLLPFQLGAFECAVRAAVPIQPLVIRGSRHVLRGDDIAPRPGTIQVEALARRDVPAVPEEAQWTAAVALRREVRAAMLVSCREPDLARHGLRTRLDDEPG